MPRVADVQVHAPQADAAVLYVGARDGSDQTLLVAHAAALADAEAVDNARGREAARSVTQELHPLPLLRRAQ